MLHIRSPAPVYPKRSICSSTHVSVSFFSRTPVCCSTHLILVSSVMGFRSKKPPSPSSAHPCAELRAAYHDCFNSGYDEEHRWYSEKFSKGQWEKEECVSEWEKYRACLAQHLEDKNLSRLLLEAEAAAYLTRDGPSDGSSH